MPAVAYASAAEQPHLFDAVQAENARRPGASSALIDDKLRLSTAGLETYFFSRWEPLLVDLMVVAAAVEYCDVSCRRPSHGWARSFDVRVAVHSPDHWQQDQVREALTDVLGFLTGDLWTFSFEQRRRVAEPVRQQSFELGTSARVIMPYSDGLDSRAVAALIASEESDALVRVRLGAKGADLNVPSRRRYPFTVVPYEVRVPRADRRESSARSRGFKFSVVTGVAAHLANVDRIIVTESGQGVLGPVLTVSGHSHPDYRVHPAFSRRMERFFMALLGRSARYEYPRLWSTKGETLAAAAALTSRFDWSDTRSCWQQSRQVSVDGRRRQCGICAACLLRRMSLHRAGLIEVPGTYVCEDLSASSLTASAIKGFSGFTNALHEYAIAGVLHLDHLASLAGSDLHARGKRRVAREVALAEGVDEISVEKALQGLLERHHKEWSAFLESLSVRSFIRQIASVKP